MSEFNRECSNRRNKLRKYMFIVDVERSGFAKREFGFIPKEVCVGAMGT